jgi:hypothetical protein
VRIKSASPENGFTLHIVTENGMEGDFDVAPYLDSEAFQPLTRPEEFQKIRNGGYFIEWECGADLSADTIEAHWKQCQPTTEQIA